MAQGAKVESLDAFKTFRAALIKFAESGNVALTSADSDIDRTLTWLERDQTTFWNGQLRKRHENVVRCEDAVRQKRLFKGSDGREQSAVDEMKALSTAKRLREEAEQKCIAVKKAIQILRKEAQLYKGRVQKLATTLQSDIPNAVRQLDGMAAQIEHYLSIQTDGAGVGLSEAAESIAQAAASAPKFGHEKLRDRTPKAEERLAAPVKAMTGDDAFFQPWVVGAVEPWQKEAISKLSIEMSPVDPEQKVIVARKCWTAAGVYLERMEGAFEGDSGWVIGATEDAADAAGPREFDSVRAADVIAARPDLAVILGLPVGFLVVLDGGGIAAILDGPGLDVWAIALMTIGQSADTESPAVSTSEGTAPAQPETSATNP